MTRRDIYVHNEQMDLNLRKECNFAEANDLLREWQKQWQRIEEEKSGIKFSNPRSAFESYCYKQVNLEVPHLRYLGGKNVLTIVLKSGRHPNDILLAADASKPTRTKLRYAAASKPAQSLCKKAKKARAKFRYIRNKAASFMNAKKMCTICMNSIDSKPMRVCAGCREPVCLGCMPHGRDVCRRCPATDEVSKELDLVKCCQKCTWYTKDLRRCKRCSLAICEWCSNIDYPECNNGCPARKKVSTSTPRSQILHKDASRFFHDLKNGHVQRWAEWTSSHARR